MNRLFEVEEVPAKTQMAKLPPTNIKPFEVVAREYMWFRDSHPLNKHICQIYNTIRYHGCAQREIVIAEIQEAIAKARIDIEKYKDTDMDYVHECKQRIFYGEDFLVRVNEERAARYVSR